MAFSCSTSIPPALPLPRFRSLRPLPLPAPSLSSFPSSPPELSAVPYLCSAAVHRLLSVRAMAGTPSGFNPRAGVPVYKPRSYQVLVSDAARSLVCALDDGKTRLEIDFPPLPSNISSYKGSSDEFIDANIQLVLAIVRKVQELRGIRACIVFPDQPEKRRASQLFKTALDMISDVTIGSLDDVPGGPVTSFFKSIRNTLDFDFTDENEDAGCSTSDEPASLYVFINCSTRELSTIEKKNLLLPPQLFFLIWSLTLCVLTWDFWVSRARICIIGFSLSLFLYSIFEQESTPSCAFRSGLQWSTVPAVSRSLASDA